VSCGSGSGSSISSESGWWFRFRIHGFDDQKFKKTDEKNLNNFLIENCIFQDTGEAFSPQKSTSSTSKNEI
jgi:hypothetical protein